MSEGPQDKGAEPERRRMAGTWGALLETSRNLLGGALLPVAAGRAESGKYRQTVLPDFINGKHFFSFLEETR